MSGPRNQDLELAELSHLLEAYGADETRWPEGPRARALQLIAQEQAARALLAEARALDRVLGAAPAAGTVPLAALVDRIAAAAEAQPARDAQGADEAMAGARIIALPPRAGSAQVRLPARAVPAARRSSWQAAALIAASLLVGIYLGGGVTSRLLLQDIADSIGIPAELGETVIAMSDDGSEETLP